MRFLTEEEEKKLRKVMEAEWPLHLAELDLAIHTGLRKGSQYSLTWDMVDFKGRMLNIPCADEEPTHVPLNDAAIAALRVEHDRGDGKGRVFHSARTGEPLGMGGTGSTTRCSRPGSRTFAGTTCGTNLQAVCGCRAAPLDYSGFFGAQEFGDDEAIRAFGAEQAARGGVFAESSCHHKVVGEISSRATALQVAVK